MKYLALVGTLVLSACGSIYTSPKVAKDDNVRVVRMTEQSAYEANLSPYTPSRLPAAFNSVAGASRPNVNSRLPIPSADNSVRPAQSQALLPPSQDSGPYRIGVADVILLATRAGGSTVEELSGLLAATNRRQGYTVQGDGSIAIPDVGRIQLAGLTLEEAEAAVFDILVTKNIEPAFSLEVAEFNSQRASIGGAVRNPTIAPITPKPLYLEEALQMAGGINAPDLDYTTIRIYRDGRLYQIPARDVYTNAGRVRLDDKDSVFVDTEYELTQARTYFEEQIQLTSQRRADRAQALAELNTQFNIRQRQIDEQQNNFKDRLELGAVKRQYAYLLGEVKTQVRFALPFEQTASLADALYHKDGLVTREADLSEIYVLRRSNDPREFGARTAYHLNAKNAADMLTATVFELRPNDMIFVSEQPVTVWNRVVTQITPSLITATLGANSN
ncbi:polysaccharide biosynthesis/export family protein [Paramylibacter ulvae]|nr:polysaccharide biosynthesis/export family protein [Amylibacter ulvae]